MVATRMTFDLAVQVTNCEVLLFCGLVIASGLLLLKYLKGRGRKNASKS